MRLSTTSAALVVAYSAATMAAPTTISENQLVIRDLNLDSAIAELNELKMKRGGYEDEIAKREYKIVTDVLTAIKNTNLAPQILTYFINNKTFQPIVASVIIAVLKSGLLNLTTVFQVLDQSNLVGKVVTDLIADCSLYVDLFNIAKQYIGNLIPIVQKLISNGLSSLSLRDEIYEEEMKRDLVLHQKRDELVLAERDVQDIVVNLMQSLASSGLATQVVKSLLVDPEFYPFAVELISGIIAANALPLSEIVDALKQSNLAGNLLKQILTINTFQNVITNAFAAFAGTCAASTGYGGGTTTPSTGGSGGGTGNSGTTIITNPCKRRRRRDLY